MVFEGKIAAFLILSPRVVLLLVHNVTDVKECKGT
jgi:hypothetical protein